MRSRSIFLTVTRGMGVAAIANAFVPFDAPFTLESTGLAGAFLEVRSGDTRASQSVFGGNSIYLWAYRGLSIGAATEHLIAQFTAVFPTDPEAGNALVASANLRPGGIAMLLVGGVGHFSSDYGGGSGPLPGFNTVAPVPEPSTASLCLLGLSFLGRRRRA